MDIRGGYYNSFTVDCLHARASKTVDMAFRVQNHSRITSAAGLSSGHGLCRKLCLGEQVDDDLSGPTGLR